MNEGAVRTTQSTTGIRSIPFFLRGKKNAKPALDVSTKQPSDDTRCSIPGCKQFVYVDEEGVMSEFCSLRHREYDVLFFLLRSGLKDCFLFQRSCHVRSQIPVYHVFGAATEQ